MDFLGCCADKRMGEKVKKLSNTDILERSLAMDSVLYVKIPNLNGASEWNVVAHQPPIRVGERIEGADNNTCLTFINPNPASFVLDIDDWKEDQEVLCELRDFNTDKFKAS
eukprot:g4515.t1